MWEKRGAKASGCCSSHLFERSVIQRETMMRPCPREVRFVGGITLHLKKQPSTCTIIFARGRLKTTRSGPEIVPDGEKKPRTANQMAEPALSRRISRTTRLAGFCWVCIAMGPAPSPSDPVCRRICAPGKNGRLLRHAWLRVMPSGDSERFKNGR